MRASTSTPTRHTMQVRLQLTRKSMLEITVIVAAGMTALEGTVVVGAAEVAAVATEAARTAAEEAMEKMAAMTEVKVAARAAEDNQETSKMKRITTHIKTKRFTNLRHTSNKNRKRRISIKFSINRRSGLRSER